jgi:hypothetical protein
MAGPLFHYFPKLETGLGAEKNMDIFAFFLGITNHPYSGTLPYFVHF